MTTYLVDTNILIIALNGKRGNRELLRGLVAQGNRLAVCTVVVTELFSGIKPADCRKWRLSSRSCIGTRRVPTLHAGSAVCVTSTRAKV